MKKILHVFTLLVVLFFGSCNYTPTPDKYFSVAVLNTNRINNFGSKDVLNVLKNKPFTYDSEANKIVDSNYEDYVKFNISQIEVDYQKVVDLPETEETKSMLDASKDVYNYVIEKQKDEYVKLAKMKDAGATDEELSVAAEEIDNKYAEEFDNKYDKLISIAKPYVEKNGLNVRWGH